MRPSRRAPAPSRQDHESGAHGVRATRQGRSGAVLTAALVGVGCALVCWLPGLAPAADARQRDEACAYAGADLDMKELGRLAREGDVGEAVRRACRSSAPAPPPPRPAPPPRPTPPPPP
ncbi:hypothetical protein [Streptomyces kanamyceticus]|uniref:hypothetical protein n=2 Tax=Streptomyces kanamyceticus TaxID=1967 RepID=UPI00168CF00F|nr:hypothetical protein [Streptomyces kanamyceticus]